MLRARHHSKSFTCINTFDPQKLHYEVNTIIFSILMMNKLSNKKVKKHTQNHIPSRLQNQATLVSMISLALREDSNKNEYKLLYA